jgi:signal transduction histidine kinase
MPPGRPGGQNGSMNRQKVIGWLRASVRPADTLPPLTLKGRVFDALLALGLALAAIQAGDRGPQDQQVGIQMENGVAVPVPPDPIWPPLHPVGDQRTGWTVVLLLLVVAPLMVRRRYPLSVLWALVGIASLVHNDGAALRLSFFACVIAGYSAAVFSPYRVAALISLPLVALVHTGLQTDAASVSDGAIPFLIMLPIAVAAYGLRRWKHQADESQVRMSTMEHDQIEALRRATEHERARIARELHDVVTHNVSVMVIQAGAARKIMNSSPDQARDALLAVEAGGRAAMTELRQVMGLLTLDPEGEDDLAPQPGLDGLDAAVQRMRDSGVPVELTVTGRPVPLPSGLELTVYRTVQEALTNVVKHAAGASVRVTIEYDDDQVQVEVADSGGRPGVSAAGGTGRGLIGLRERVAVHGGVLQAGPRVSGGYRVHASIPVVIP